jgi:hypothetical protein
MPTRQRLCLLLVLATAGWVSPAAGVENDEEETFVVIKASRVITLADRDYADGEIVVVNGKIRLVGTNLEYPKDSRVIDARGEVVMPGMILPRTRWQLPSYTRAGIHGDRSAAMEIYLDEIDFEPFLKAGFTAVCFYPNGTGIPGPGAVYRTAGEKENRDLGAAYLRVTMTSPSRDKKVLRDAIEKAKKEIEKVEKARKEWEEKQKKAKEAAAKKPPPAKEDKPPPKKEPPDEDKNGDDTPEKKKDEEKPKEAKTKREVFTPPKIDPAVMPLVRWIRDKKGPPILFELMRASDLRHLDDVLKRAPELPGTRLYLYGGSRPDFHHVVKDLGDRKALALLHPGVGMLPNTVTRYHLPAEMALAGASVVLSPRAYSASDVEQFRIRLADSVRAGLPRKEALKAVTINAARLLGMEERLGTIEKGKDADFVFLRGDPLSPGARVTRVMTFGEIAWEAPQTP